MVFYSIVNAGYGKELVIGFKMLQITGDFEYGELICYAQSKVYHK